MILSERSIHFTPELFTAFPTLKCKLVFQLDPETSSSLALRYTLQNFYLKYLKNKKIGKLHLLLKKLCIQLKVPYHP